VTFEVLAIPAARVELSDRTGIGHLNNETVIIPAEDDHVIKFTSHTFLGDVIVRTVGGNP
jgi:hypothetical protein